MFRFSPSAITHLAAVERFIKNRGGLKKMPTVMQDLVVMGDLLQCLCLDTPLAFNTLGPAPTLQPLVTAGGPPMPQGDALQSCPFLICDDENLSMASRYVADPAIAAHFPGILQTAADAFQRFFGNDTPVGVDAGIDLDAVADTCTLTCYNGMAIKTADVFLQACALAARITQRTLSKGLAGFNHPANGPDVQALYDNMRFIGLKPWAGLPYVYVWVYDSVCF